MLAPGLAAVRELMRKAPLEVEVAAPGSDKSLASGRVAFLDNAVDQTTGTIKVRAIFENGDAALWPGQFYTVRVRLYDQENAIPVPSRAVQNGPGGQFVYVVKPDQTVEIRKVVVDRTEGDTSVLAAGSVAKGDPVVVRGALRLAPRGQGNRDRRRAAVVNLSEIFVRRPVMTVLVMTLFHKRGGR